MVVSLEISRKNYSLIIDERAGSLRSLSNGRHEFIAQTDVPVPLFQVRLRSNGIPVDVSATDAEQCSCSSERSTVVLSYRNLKHLPIHVTVRLMADDAVPTIMWYISVENGTDYILEWIDFPGVVVPNDLIATGGDYRIVWPALEGVLVEDADLRQRGWLQYHEPGYPSHGWEGIYPGPSPTQFMAYYGPQGGLYLGAHDPSGHVKSIEYRREAAGVHLQFRVFADGFGRGTYDLDYPMTLSLFDGDWHDAAEIYRRWFSRSSPTMPPGLKDNPHVPQWVHQSPVIVTYPVRGTRDTGPMEPNEYFPYTQILPHLKTLSQAFDSPVMPLLMHWEGTAPWAPPYVWPPFGGAPLFAEFVQQAHEQGHWVGVYASGIGWTTESLLISDYRPPVLSEDSQTATMCTGPDGTVELSNICAGGQRWGYDMCPSQPWVTTIVATEVANIASSGVDYIQFFDQNLGGLSYACYSNLHGHPPTPGKWQTHAMKQLFGSIHEVTEASHRVVGLGCEAAAAEPFIADLPVNDLRFNIGLWAGYPIPIYQYLYHEHISNFMGNQNSVGQTIDLEQSPENILWRTAYAFAVGELLTVVLKDHGQINWDWGTAWDLPSPDQDLIIHLIRNLNPWRTQAGQPYLMYGRMLKPFEVRTSSTQTIAMRAGHRLQFPSVLTSRWQSLEDQTTAQFLINYTPTRQTGQVRLTEPYPGVPDVVNLDGSRTRIATDASFIVSVTVPPLSCIMIQWPNTRS